MGPSLHSAHMSRKGIFDDTEGESRSLRDCPDAQVGSAGSGGEKPEMGDAKVRGDGDIVAQVVGLALAKAEGCVGHEGMADIGDEGAEVGGDLAAAENKAASYCGG